MPLLDEYQAFLSLAKLGVGHSAVVFPVDVDWNAVLTLASQQGLLSVIIDGIEHLPVDKRPPKKVLVPWAGLMIQDEAQSALQRKTAGEMASLFHGNGVRTYVLKGDVVAECYPNPAYRLSSDMDCFLLPESGDFDAWALGNELIKAKGFETGVGFYKNSTFHLPGLMVENHRFLTPFRGNERLKRLELLLQASLRADKGEDRFDGTWLYRPPVLVSALFLIEHAYSHFLHEGLTWRMVLDWVLFCRRHWAGIDWPDFEARIDEFGFRRFYDSFQKLGRYLLGEVAEGDLCEADRLMLADVWADLDLHETLHGVKGKLALAGNTWRARWKYEHFTDMTWVRALWIQAKGVLFERQVGLG